MVPFLIDFLFSRRYTDESISIFQYKNGGYAVKRLRVGILGCGKIAAVYAANLQNHYQDRLELLLCADIDAARAEVFAQEHSIRSVSVDGLITSAEIDTILNLTIPAAHYPLSLAALRNGKHVYSEKPLAMTLKEADELIAEAASHGLYLGCAPDTFLGGGIQTVCRLLEEDAIGTPVSFAIHMLARGPEYTHPRPEFYYEPGAGPLMDMGPYYITALVAMLGPVKSVFGLGGSVFPNRFCRAPERLGDTFRTSVDTSVCAVLRLTSGLAGTLHISWDHPHCYWESGAPFIEIRGSKGRIECPDPNTFGGSYGAFSDPPENRIHLFSASGESSPVALDPDCVTFNARGIGLYEAARAMEEGQRPVVHAGLARHVLEVLLGIERSCQTGQPTEMAEETELKKFIRFF